MLSVPEPVLYQRDEQARHALADRLSRLLGSIEILEIRKRIILRGGDRSDRGEHADR